MNVTQTDKRRKLTDKEKEVLTAVLEYAKEKLSGRDAHCKMVSALNKDNESVDVEDDSAVKWDLPGAVFLGNWHERSYAYELSELTYKIVSRQLPKNFEPHIQDDIKRLSAFNDLKSTTTNDVLDLLDKAIKSVNELLVSTKGK
jgi:hypothetical protein